MSTGGSRLADAGRRCGSLIYCFGDDDAISTDADCSPQTTGTYYLFSNTILILMYE